MSPVQFDDIIKALRRIGNQLISMGEAKIALNIPKLHLSEDGQSVSFPISKEGLEKIKTMKEDAAEAAKDPENQEKRRILTEVTEHLEMLEYEIFSKLVNHESEIIIPLLDKQSLNVRNISVMTIYAPSEYESQIQAAVEEALKPFKKLALEENLKPLS